jgi:group II intron reverse transcriptase/maturase
LEIQKPFNISKELVREAFKKVKSNKGAAGVDSQSLEMFEKDLENNLYMLWNRMASGSYFPPPVKAVEIPKRSGGKRLLGIPTVMDRIAQAVVVQVIEGNIEKYFHEDSYGYRPGKQALDAIGKTRKRCWEYQWLLEYDIKGLFDNINHEKLMKAVNGHVKEKWARLYIERWLKAPIQHKNRLEERNKGTPQGGVISPLLSNLFMHYAIDEWLKRNYSSVPWARYADDGIMHFSTKIEAESMLESLGERLKECDLALHAEKTKIVYCGKEKLKERRTFNFLGYTFQARRAASGKTGEIFTSFLPAISKEKAKEIRAEIRRDNIRARADLSLEQIAEWYNPKIRGWYNYFGKYYPSKMVQLWKYLNQALALWARSKYKNLRTSRMKAMYLIKRIQVERENLFFHWKLKQGKEAYV